MAEKNGRAFPAERSALNKSRLVFLHGHHFFAFALQHQASPSFLEALSDPAGEVSEALSAPAISSGPAVLFAKHSPTPKDAAPQPEQFSRQDGVVVSSYALCLSESRNFLLTPTLM